ncbi:MAG TPA: hypothetical protein DCE56_20660 [Cyanobacteria bacterium UBA8553]|nr:hypothetical protein [Cyanobacteria bacterium UBA8553]HAJ58091.1 hypothetical protein [Cyanobacteria bacterium UBA8543]
MLESLQKHLSLCKSIYPNFTDEANNIFNQFIILSKSDDNPLLDSLAELQLTSGKVACLLKESRLIPAVESLLSEKRLLRKIELLVPSQLRGRTCYKRLVILGPTRWFPEYVFNAPRASDIQVIHYNWIRDKWKPEPVFIGSVNVPKSEFLPILKPEKVKDTIDNEVVANHLEPEEIMLPSINWNQITNNLVHSSLASLDSEDEDTEARLFLLEGGDAVFLDADAKAMVINLEEDEPVKRIAVADIEPGMFVLLRTSSGGDYIIPLADRILGENAQRTRELQNEWKTLLRQKVKSIGLPAVSENLVKLGSRLANVNNVRHWMLNSSIKPRDDKDFEAILRFVGLENRLNQFSDAAYKLNSAHSQAGKYIRKLLLKQVCQSDLQQLQQLGRMDFKLDEVDSGNITAFRVVDIDSELRMISASKIAQSFEIERQINNV